MFKMKKHGFTLVELSIVLVIIGLLIGGILVAQSLIDSSKVQAQVREFNQIKIAYDLFKDRFRCIPGDCTKAFGASAGDGNGLLDCRHERANFWFHLNNTGFLTSDTYTGTHSSCSTNYILRHGQNTYPSSHSDYAAYHNSSARVRGTVRRNAIHFAKFDGSPTLYPSNVGGALVDPKFALSIDQKMDDKDPLAGDIQGAEGNDNYSTAPTDCTSTNSWTDSAAPATRSYSVANDGERCLIVYYIDE